MWWEQKKKVKMLLQIRLQNFILFFFLKCQLFKRKTLYSSLPLHSTRLYHLDRLKNVEVWALIINVFSKSKRIWKKKQKTNLLYRWSANSSKERGRIHSVLQAKAYCVLSWKQNWLSPKVDNFLDANNNSKNQRRLCMKEHTRHMRPIKRSGRNNGVSLYWSLHPSRVKTETERCNLFMQT